MIFSVKPVIRSSESIAAFIKEWKVGKYDLIITNEYVLLPALKGEPLPCDVLYQEKFGSGEPSDEMVDLMLKQADGREYKRIIAVGGGTVIDIAKLFVFGRHLVCAEIFAKGSELAKKRQLIILPTTCGTGSEATNISIVSFLKKETKIGLAVPALYADEAVLIGSLLETMPFTVFAHASIDALIHAMESHLSPKANSFTRAMGRSAIETIIDGYHHLIATREKKLPARGTLENFLTASTMAGIAFGNAGCAAVHALSYPIGSIYHVPHGKSNYLVLGAVFDAYKRLGAKMSSLEKILAATLQVPENSVWQELAALLKHLETLQPLSELGMNTEKCQEMAQSVAQNQQRLLANTPVPLSEEEICAIYRACL